jgi:hypothetical protein
VAPVVRGVDGCVRLARLGQSRRAAFRRLDGLDPARPPTGSSFRQPQRFPETLGGPSRGEEIPLFLGAGAKLGQFTANQLREQSVRRDQASAAERVTRVSPQHAAVATERGTRELVEQLADSFDGQSDRSLNRLHRHHIPC